MSRMSVPRLPVRVLAPAAAIASLAPVAAASAALSLAPPAEVAAGPNVGQFVAGDLNGDGRRDLAVANVSQSSTGQVSVLITQPGGGFAPRRVFPAGTGPEGVAIGDVDGDGPPDLVTANIVNNSITVLHGDGTGGFGAPVTIPAGATPNAVAVGDVTGDGLPDVLVTRPMPFDAVGVMAGDGTGGFSAPTDVPVLDPTGPAVIAEFGGTTAFVVPRLPSNAVQIVSRIAGVLSPGLALGVATPADVAAADLNGDGRVDLAAASRDAGIVSVLMGTGSGAFAAPRAFAVGAQPTAVAVADLDRDGNPDIAVRTESGVTVLLGGGNGDFVTGTTVPLTGGAVGDLLAGDFTGDSAPDLVAQNGTPDSLAVLRNQGIPRARALDFGQQLRRTPGPVTELTVNNDGAAPLRMSSAVVSGTNASDFTTVANECTSAPVPAGGRCTVALRFTPGAVGSEQAVLTLSHDGAGPALQVPLTGDGVGPRLLASLGLSRYTGRHGSRLSVRYLATDGAAVTVELQRARRVALSARQTARAGTNTVRLRLPARRGRYTLVLRARTPDGRAAGDRATVSVR
jgi:VCBS repeat protein/FG-GAP repeat protein